MAKENVNIHGIIYTYASFKVEERREKNIEGRKRTSQEYLDEYDGENNFN